MTLALTALFAFVFGAIIGSFLNVVIHRVPLGESIVSPPSHCPVCDNQIAWYDNIPIVSWLALGGECRHCGTSVSPRYIGVEALVGALSAAVWIKVAGGAGLSEAGLVGIDPALVGVPYFFYFAFVCLVVSIAFIDLEHLIIPHEISIPGIILGIVAGFVLEAVIPPEQLVDMWPPMTSFMSVTGAVVGGGSVIAIFVFYMAVRGIPAMGGGDVTLMALVGAWLGWPAVLFVFFAASIQGLIAYGAAVAFGLEGFVRDAQEIFDEMDEEDEIARVRAPSKPEAPEGDEEEPSEEVAEDETEGEDVAEVEDEEVEVEGDGEAAEEAAAAEVPGEDEGGAEAEGAEEVEEADEEAEEASEEVGGEVDDEEASEEAEEGEVELVVEEEEGPPAIPFGPFIVLGALEHFFLGGLLGPQYSMMMFYLDYF
jgi:leader peptidase (prepilin peptidase)/N-methyltransferase